MRSLSESIKEFGEKSLTEDLKVVNGTISFSYKSDKELEKILSDIRKKHKIKKDKFGSVELEQVILKSSKSGASALVVLDEAVEEEIDESIDSNKVRFALGGLNQAITRFSDKAEKIRNGNKLDKMSDEELSGLIKMVKELKSNVEAESKKLKA